MVVLVLSWISGWTLAMAAPDPAALAAEAHRHERWLPRPAGWQFSVGMLEVRDQSSQSLLLLELQFPLIASFTGSLSGTVPGSRQDLHYQVAMGLNFHSFPPYRRFWAQVAYVQDVMRVGVARARLRTGVGWRWHAPENPASFGLLIGPERDLDAGTWGAVLRVDMSTDFWLGDLFW